MDLYARKIIAYKVSTRIDTQLAINTLDAAFAARGKCHNVIFTRIEAANSPPKPFENTWMS